MGEADLTNPVLRACGRGDEPLGPKTRPLLDGVEEASLPAGL